MMAGSSSSPRLAMKILLGVSAKTPACDPHVYPFGAIGFGKPATTLYGPVSSSPPFSWAKTGVENKPHAMMAASTNVGVRIAHLPLKKICGTDRHRRRSKPPCPAAPGAARRKGSYAKAARMRNSARPRDALSICSGQSSAALSSARFCEQPQNLHVHPDQSDHDAERSVPFHVLRRASVDPGLDEAEIQDQIERGDDHDDRAQPDAPRSGAIQQRHVPAEHA